MFVVFACTLLAFYSVEQYLFFNNMLINNKALVGCFVFCSVLVLVYAVTITIIYARAKFHENKNSTERQKIKCESYGCVQAAAQIVSYIDDNIDPCDNFYQFANGQYIKEMTDDTDDWESHGLYSTVSKLVNKKIGPLLSEPSQPDEWKVFRLAKTFYQSCLSQWKIVTRVNEQLAEILHELGGWPVVQGSSWSSRKFDLIEMMGKVKKCGFETNSIFTLDVGVDRNNVTNRRLVIDKGNYDNNEDDDTVYRKTMVKAPAYFMSSVDQKEKDLIRIKMTRVWAFELKLLNSDYDGNVDVEESNSESYTDNGDYSDDQPLTTIKELQKSYPYWNWLAYINAMLPYGLVVTENEPIENGNPKFFANLGEILKSTSNQTLANYIVWRVVYNAYRMAIHETGKTLRDKCIDLTSKKFSIPVSLLYSRKYFNETARQAAINLVEDVRHSFITMLREVTWMDNATRAKAIEKAQNIVAHVGYPSGMFQSHVLHEYYGPLEMEPNDFFHNCLQWNILNYNDRFKKLRRPANRSGWETVLDSQPNEANAFYDPASNMIQFPPAILHEKFFSMDRPHYINYASLGNTVGHEITHGFDSSGRNFDLNGNYVNWWNEETEKEFLNKSECFVQQYNRYEDAKTQLQVDGAQTLDENIADNGGTRAAYYAYQNWKKRNGPEKLITGIKYNQNQLFWISYAQAEGEVFGENYLRDVIEYDEHAPVEFRINGVVSNTREFAKDFNCPEGTKMNPTKKCKIW